MTCWTSSPDSIIDAELHSSLKLAKHGKPDLHQCDDTWAYQFLKMALAGATREEVKSIFDNVTVINFNYDRAFECYLFWALQEFGNLSPAEAQELVDGLCVIRPYGDLGKIDWPGQGKGTPYGGRKFPTDLLDWSKTIRTFSEQDESDVSKRIEQALTDADLILILGFGFHEQNVELLRPKFQRPSEGDRRHVFATMKKIAQDNKPVLQETLVNCFKTQHVILTDRTAAELLSELYPSIMAVGGKPRS